MRVQHNRTAEAKALLQDVEAWCSRTGTPETTIGRVLYRHPGLVGLLRKRLTVTLEKERQVRGFMAEHPKGWSGELPKTHGFGVTRPLRSSKIRLVRGPLLRTDIISETEIAARRIDRDPCPRCGVRGDIGCKHQAGAY